MNNFFQFRQIFIKRKLFLTIILFNYFFCGILYAYEIQGIVCQPDGKPCSNALVWLVHSIQGVAKTEVNKDGQFIFSNYPLGEVTIIARDNNKKLGGCSFILMQDENRVVINLFEGVQQKLRVLNPNLIPISGAYIRRLWIGDKFWIPSEDVAELGYGWLRSDDNGEIILSGMPPDGFIRILISHVEFTDTYMPFIPVNEKKSMDIILKKGTLVRGRVVKEGKGIKDAFIVALQKGANRERLILPAKTDAEGLYRLRLDKGEYRIFATHPDFPNTLPKELSITEEEQEEIVLDFNFENPLHIQGIVQLMDGEPCKLAKVAIKEENGVEDFVFTNEKGEYFLKSSSKKVKIKIIPPPGFITENLPEIPIDFQNKDKISVPPVRIKKLPEISGKVVFSDGKEGDKVFIRTKNLPFPFYTLTDNEGNFQVLFNMVPDINPVKFVAEHALRFVRNEFSVDVYNKNNEPLNIVLDSYEPNQEKFVNKDANIKLSHLLDSAAPKIQCRSWFNYKGTNNPLQDMQGKVILILFWGGFDTTIRGRMYLEEMRALFDLYKGISDVAFISIHDGASNEDEVENYIKEFHIAFPVGIDTEQANTFNDYSIDSIPQFVLIDKRGVLRYTDLENRTVELIKILRRTPF